MGYFSSPTPKSSALVAACLAALAGGCAAPAGGGGGAAPAPSASAGDVPAGRPGEIIAAWRAVGAEAWRTGLVPLQELTVPPPHATLTPAAREALTRGVFRITAALPARPVARDRVTLHADGSAIEAPVLEASAAFALLAAGSADQCADPCAPLTVTAARYGSVDLRTSRGSAAVPAWRFAVRELGGAEVARVAVPSETFRLQPPVRLPEPPPALLPVEQFRVQGTAVTYEVGATACDRDFAPRLTAAADAVVLGATATRGSGPCNRQHVVRTLTATLPDVLGSRTVLDEHTGRVLAPEAAR